MAKEKVTLTLDAELLAEFRELVDARSLSASVERALTDRIAHLRHMAALGRLLEELAERDGPPSEEDRAWAEAVFADRDARVAASASAGTGRSRDAR